jgi:hypothetical protein
MKKTQGASYPRLTSFQSPAQSPRTHDPPSDPCSSEDPTSVNGARPCTVRSVKARDRGRKDDPEPFPEDAACLGAPLQPKFAFNNSDSLLRYKGQGQPSRIRRSSGTPSDMTDSTTSGSYMIQTDIDDLGSQRNIRELNV